VPRRSTLTLAERESLFAVPTDEAELIRRYAFSEQELSVIQQHRGDHNRLGFAVQLCYMRYPGYILPVAPAARPPLSEAFCPNKARCPLMPEFNPWSILGPRGVSPHCINVYIVVAPAPQRRNFAHRD
jgi:hypothetical protein